jgi:hypothetical protein
MIYGDRTIVGFVGFDQQMAPWSAPEKELLFVRLRVRKIIKSA